MRTSSLSLIFIIITSSLCGQNTKGTITVKKGALVLPVLSVAGDTVNLDTVTKEKLLSYAVVKERKFGQFCTYVSWEMVLWANNASETKKSNGGEYWFTQDMKQAIEKLPPYSTITIHNFRSRDETGNVSTLPDFSLVVH